MVSSSVSLDVPARVKPDGARAWWHCHRPSQHDPKATMASPTGEELRIGLRRKKGSLLLLIAGGWWDESLRGGGVDWWWWAGCGLWAKVAPYVRTSFVSYVVLRPPTRIPCVVWTRESDWWWGPLASTVQRDDVIWGENLGFHTSTVYIRHLWAWVKILVFGYFDLFS